MNEILNRLIEQCKSGEKMQETTLLKTNEQNVTPEWIDTLKENEIFVFGCRIQAGTLMAHRTLH